jgi:hypothetical protein
MTPQANPKELFKFDIKRDFGELIGAPFYFIRQEFKPFMRSLIRYAGPFIAFAVLGMALFSNDIYDAVMSDVFPANTTWIYLALFALFLMLGFLSAVVTAHAYFTCYVKLGKDNFTIEDVGALLKKKVFTVFLTGILAYIMVVIGFLLLYIPGIYIAICMTFFPIIIVFEDTNVGDAISRSFKVANKKWWLTFGAVLIFGMIIGFSLYVFLIPIYAVIIAAAIGGTQIGTGSVILIVLFVILYFVAYIFAIALQQVLVAAMYFNIVTEKEGMGLQDRINLINNDDKNVFTVVDKEPETKQETKEESKTPEEEQKPEDINRFANKDESNRFTDDENNRFKPKL